MSMIVRNGCLALFAELRHGASAPPNFIALPMTHSADGKQMGILVVNSAGAVDNSILTLWPQAAMYHGVPNWEARVVYPSMANTPSVDATIRTITQAATMGSSPSHTMGNSSSPSKPPAAASPKPTYSPKLLLLRKGAKPLLKLHPLGPVLHRIPRPAIPHQGGAPWVRLQREEATQATVPAPHAVTPLSSRTSGRLHLRPRRLSAGRLHLRPR